jgi:hypothetical protein
MTSPNETLKAGALNAAISNAVVRLLGEHAGRWPTKARTLRHLLQHTMRTRLTAAVEALTHRRVAAFLSDEPLPETAHVREGQ